MEALTRADGGFAWGRGLLRIMCVRAWARGAGWRGFLSSEPHRASSLGSQQQPRTHHHHHHPPPPPHHHLPHHSRSWRGETSQGEKGEPEQTTTRLASRWVEFFNFFRIKTSCRRLGWACSATVCFTKNENRFCESGLKSSCKSWQAAGGQFYISERGSWTSRAGCYLQQSQNLSRECWWAV